jgi:hypothetical protein
MLQIRSQKDFFSGLFYIAVGLGFALVARDYTMGTAAKMGPGYFPFWLGLLLAVLGLIVSLQALGKDGEADRLDRWDIKTLLWILGSVVLFGLLLRPLGLVLALVVLVLVASMASHEFRWKGTILNTIFLIIFAMGAFIYGLNLQFPLWPAFIAP